MNYHLNDIIDWHKDFAARIETVGYIGDESYMMAKDVLEILDDVKSRECGCSWCKNFAGVPLRGFTLHGCQKITVKYCPNCGKDLTNV